MEKVYLENARSLFLNPPYDKYYDGRNSNEFDNFIRMVGYIIPNKVTPEELIVYLEFLIHDIKDGVCRFHNSKSFKEAFESYKLYSSDLEKWMTYFPSFSHAVFPTPFHNAFMELFKREFYQMEQQQEDNTYECVEVKKDVIDISKKDKADVLAALYNFAKPVGMGIIQYDPTPMTKETAQYVLEKLGPSFGYLKGRPIKCYIEGDLLDVCCYNRDNDQDGLAQRAIATCPNISNDIQKTLN